MTPRHSLHNKWIRTGLRHHRQQIQVPGATHLWHFLSHEAGSLYSYLLAFLVRWIIWRQDHTVLDRISRVPGPMMMLHFLLPLLSGLPGALRQRL
ncbi:TMEM175 family protein [Streptomyces sp. NPDC059928]|uniref:TMEM175 family protein n=1 Tax=unclassified Streptomyces TaxID=2593676 RepID=UPI003657124F